MNSSTTGAISPPNGTLPKERLYDILKKIIGATEKDLKNVDIVLKKEGEHLIIEFRKIDSKIKSDLEKVLNHTSRKDALGTVVDEQNEIQKVKYEIEKSHPLHDELDMLCQAWPITHKEELNKLMDHIQTKI